MDSITLNIISKLRKCSQSQLAIIAGVSRQAVSLWKKQSTISLRSKNLQKLADGLGVKIDDLVRPLPILNNKKLARTYQTTLLWDHLFPNLEDYIIALVNHDPRAIARLIQVYGLYTSAKIIGPLVWKRFNLYKHYIHPIRRTQCEIIWNQYQNPKLI